MIKKYKGKAAEAEMERIQGEEKKNLNDLIKRQGIFMDELIALQRKHGFRLKGAKREDVTPQGDATYYTIKIFPYEWKTDEKINDEKEAKEGKKD